MLDPKEWDYENDIEYQNRACKSGIPLPPVMTRSNQRWQPSHGYQDQRGYDGQQRRYGNQQDNYGQDYNRNNRNDAWGNNSGGRDGNRYDSRNDRYAPSYQHQQQGRVDDWSNNSSVYQEQRHPDRNLNLNRPPIQQRHQEQPYNAPTVNEDNQNKFMQEPYLPNNLISIVELQTTTIPTTTTEEKTVTLHGIKLTLLDQIVELLNVEVLNNTTETILIDV